MIVNFVKIIEYVEFKAREYFPVDSYFNKTLGKENIYRIERIVLSTAIDPNIHIKYLNKNEDGTYDYVTEREKKAEVGYDFYKSVLRNINRLEMSVETLNKEVLDLKGLINDVKKLEVNVENMRRDTSIKKFWKWK